MEATVIEKEILKILLDNNAKLVYEIGDFPIGITYEKDGVLPIEIFDEIKHISKSVYFSCN
jgi:hypothetical protein